MPRVEHEFTVERMGLNHKQTITLIAKAEGFYNGGSWGLPEYSEPAEGEITELEIFTEDDKPWDDKLTKEEEEKLCDKLMEIIIERQSDDGD